MNITALLDNSEMLRIERPGAQLATIRVNKGLSTAYIAEKLHLRVQLIDWLETDTYDRLPEPVFIKGYLRAYARVLDVLPEPYIQAFLSLSNDEPSIDKPIWKAARLPKQKKSYRLLMWPMTFVLMAAVGSFIWNKYQQGVTNVDHPIAQGTAVETPVQEIQTILPQVDRMKSFFQTVPQTLEAGGEVRE